MISSGSSRMVAVSDARTFLQCEAQGMPRPSVTWRRDGVPIPSNSDKHRQHPSGSLDFSYVTVNDTGSYKCTATNIAGSMSSTVELIVHSEFKGQSLKLLLTSHEIIWDFIILSISIFMFV